MRGMLRRWVVLWIAVVLAAVACGGDGDRTAAPIEVERIVSASPSHTEILYALGVGDLVIATDLTSNFPAAAAETGKFDAFNVSVEAVAAFEPDLVILFYDPGDVVEGLEALGITTLLFSPPATLDDVFDQIRDLGEAVHRPDEAAALIDQMQGDLAAVIESIPETDEAPTYYHELDPSMYTVTSDTFVGGLFASLGLENIADVVDDGTGFPQLSSEYLLQANPNFIFLADTKCCGESEDTVAERPGWDTLDAVSEGRVVELDDDVAQRWGPRIVDLVAAVAGAVYG